MAFEVSYFALQYSQEDMDLNNKQWEEALEKERAKHLELNIRENENNNQPDLDQQPQRLKELEIGKRDNANDHQQREYQCGEHTDDDYVDNQQNNEHEYDADDDYVDNQQNNENEYTCYVNYHYKKNINSENIIINKQERDEEKQQIYEETQKCSIPNYPGAAVIGRYGSNKNEDINAINYNHNNESSYPSSTNNQSSSSYQHQPTTVYTESHTEESSYQTTTDELKYNAPSSPSKIKRRTRPDPPSHPTYPYQFQQQSSLPQPPQLQQQQSSFAQKPSQPTYQHQFQQQSSLPQPPQLQQQQPSFAQKPSQPTYRHQFQQQSHPPIPAAFNSKSPPSVPYYPAPYPLPAKSHRNSITSSPPPNLDSVSNNQSRKPNTSHTYNTYNNNHIQSYDRFNNDSYNKHNENQQQRQIILAQQKQIDSLKSHLCKKDVELAQKDWKIRQLKRDKEKLEEELDFVSIQKEKVEYKVQTLVEFVANYQDLMPHDMFHFIQDFNAMNIPTDSWKQLSQGPVIRSIENELHKTIRGWGAEIWSAEPRRGKSQPSLKSLSNWLQRKGMVVKCSLAPPKFEGPPAKLVKDAFYRWWVINKCHDMVNDWRHPFRCPKILGFITLNEMQKLLMALSAITCYLNKPQNFKRELIIGKERIRMKHQRDGNNSNYGGYGNNEDKKDNHHHHQHKKINNKNGDKRKDKKFKHNKALRFRNNNINNNNNNDIPSYNYVWTEEMMSTPPPPDLQFNDSNPGHNNQRDQPKTTKKKKLN